MALYSAKEQLYLETNALGVGLGASLLKGRDRMWFLRNEAPDNAALVAFVTKSLTSAETHYSNIETEALGILNDLEKVHPYCFTHKVSDKRPQTIGCNFQK